MQPGPGRPLQAAFVLGAAGAFGALLWTVMLHLLSKGGLPSTDRLVPLLLPAALGSIALGFGCGLWIGRRRRMAQDMAIAAAGQAQAAQAAQAARIQADLHRAAERAEAETRRVALLMDTAAPGAALFDAAHRLMAWSRGFAALVEVPDVALHPGLTLAELVRLQPASPTRKMSRHGIESGIAGAARRQRGDGSHVEDRWSPAAEGGMLLTCRPAEAPRRGVPLSARALAALCEEEVRTRLPRLQAAVAAGDAAAARMEAHAIRGVAGSFGLDALAEALLTLETAARAGDLAALVAASAGLPQLAEADLRHLARQPA